MLLLQFLCSLSPYNRDTAEQLLYRLRELEEDAFVRISHTLGLGPIDYQRRISGQMTVSFNGEFLRRADCRCARKKKAVMFLLTT